MGLEGCGSSETCQVPRGDREPRSLWPWGRGGPWTGRSILPWAPLRAPILSLGGLGADWQWMGTCGSGDRPRARPLSGLASHGGAYLGQSRVRDRVPPNDRNRYLTPGSAWLRGSAPVPGHLSVGSWGRGPWDGACDMPSRWVSRAEVCTSVGTGGSALVSGQWPLLLVGPTCVPEAKARSLCCPTFHEAPPCPAVPGARLLLQLLPGEEEELEPAAGVLCPGV